MRLIFSVISWVCSFIFGGFSYILGYGWLVKDSEEFLWNPLGIIMNVLFVCFITFICQYLAGKLED